MRYQKMIKSVCILRVFVKEKVQLTFGRMGFRLNANSMADVLNVLQHKYKGILVFTVILITASNKVVFCLSPIL